MAGRVVPGGLPWQPASLIGRDREVAQVRELLRRPEIRLLTLVARERRAWQSPLPPIWSTGSSMG